MSRVPSILSCSIGPENGCDVGERRSKDASLCGRVGALIRTLGDKPGIAALLLGECGNLTGSALR